MNEEIRIIRAIKNLQEKVDGKVDAIEQVEGVKTVRCYLDMPLAKNGLDGRDGKDGKDGYTPIKDVDYFDGRDGKDGLNGKDGYTPIKNVDYFDGRDGKDGLNGKDGRGIHDMYIDTLGHLIVIFTDGQKVDLGRVVGLNGKNGRNGFSGGSGADGVGIDEVTINSNSHLIVTYTNGTIHDAGFVGGGGTSAVTSVNGRTGAVTITAEELGALTEHQSLSGYATETYVNNQIGQIAIPTKTSDLTNDSGFLTQHQNISGKQNISTLETDVKAFINKAYIESLLDNGDGVAY